MSYVTGFPGGFQSSTNLPLDYRAVVDDISALEDVVLQTVYQGLIVFDKATAKHYEITGGDGTQIGLTYKVFGQGDSDSAIADIITNRGPTNNDDADSSEYTIAKLTSWLNEETGELYLCTDNTAGAAVWIRYVTEGDLTGLTPGTGFVLEVGDEFAVAPATSEYTLNITDSDIGNNTSGTKYEVHVNGKSVASVPYVSNQSSYDINVSLKKGDKVRIVKNYSLIRVDTSVGSNSLRDFAVVNNTLFFTTGSFDIHKVSMFGGTVSTITGSGSTSGLIGLTAVGDEVWCAIGSDTDTIRVYNTISETWSTKTVSAQITSLAMEYNPVDGMVYYSGGYDYGYIDPETLTVTEIGTILGAVSVHCRQVAISKDGLVALMDDNGDVVYIFNPANQTFESYDFSGAHYAMIWDETDTLYCPASGVAGTGFKISNGILTQWDPSEMFGASYLEQTGRYASHNDSEGLNRIAGSYSGSDKRIFIDNRTRENIRMVATGTPVAYFSPTLEFAFGIALDRDPLPTDDADSTEYTVAVNQTWNNTASGAIFTCTDATPGAAVWKKSVTEDELPGAAELRLTRFPNGSYSSGTINGAITQDSPLQTSNFDLTVAKDGIYQVGGMYPFMCKDLAVYNPAQTTVTVPDIRMDMYVFRDSQLTLLAQGVTSVTHNDITSAGCDLIGTFSFNEILELKANDILTFQFYFTSLGKTSSSTRLLVNYDDSLESLVYNTKNTPWLRELEVATYLPAGDYSYGIKSNRDPLPTDDENSPDFPVAINQVWFNESTGNTFVCQDATVDNAVWNAYVTADQIPGFQDTQYVALTDVTQTAVVSETALHRFGVTLAGTGLHGAELWMTVNGSDAIEFDMSSLPTTGTVMFSTDQFTALNKDDVISFRWVPNGAIISSFGFAGGIQPTTYYAPLKDFTLGIKEQRDPNENDDSDAPGLFIQVNQIWHNEANASIWICTDATPGAAVWKRMVTEDDLPGFSGGHSFSLTSFSDTYVAPEKGIYDLTVQVSGYNLDQFDIKVLVNGLTAATVKDTTVSVDKQSIYYETLLTLNPSDVVTLVAFATTESEEIVYSGSLTSSIHGIYDVHDRYIVHEGSTSRIVRFIDKATGAMTTTIPAGTNGVTPSTLGTQHTVTYADNGVLILDREGGHFWRYSNDGGWYEESLAGLPSGSNNLFSLNTFKNSDVRIIKHASGDRPVYIKRPGALMYSRLTDQVEAGVDLDNFYYLNERVFATDTATDIVYEILGDRTAVALANSDSSPSPSFGTIYHMFGNGNKLFVPDSGSADCVYQYDLDANMWSILIPKNTNSNLNIALMDSPIDMIGETLVYEYQRDIYIVSPNTERIWFASLEGDWKSAIKFNAAKDVLTYCHIPDGSGVRRQLYKARVPLYESISATGVIEPKGTYVPVNELDLGIVTDRDPTGADSSASNEFYITKNQLWHNEVNGTTWICVNDVPFETVWKKYVTEDELTGLDYIETYALSIPETENPSGTIESDRVQATEDGVKRFDIRSRVQVPRGKSVFIELIYNNNVIWSNTQTEYNYKDSVEIFIGKNTDVYLRATISDTNRWQNSLANSENATITFGDCRDVCANDDYVMAVEYSADTIMMCDLNENWFDVSAERTGWNSPFSCATDGSSFYVADRGDGEIWRRTTGGAWFQVTGQSFNDLYCLSGMPGFIYALDENGSNGALVYKFTVEDQSWVQLPITGLPGASGNTNTATSARSIAVDPATGDVYLYDATSNLKRIYKFTEATQEWAEWGDTTTWTNVNMFAFRMTVNDGYLWCSDLDTTSPAIRTIRRFDLATERDIDWGAQNGLNEPTLSRHIRGVGFRRGKMYAGDLLQDTVWSFETHKVGPVSAGFARAPRAYYLPADNLNIGVKETRDPIETDDSSSLDYEIKVNQLWLNETAGTFWICKDDTVGNAVWARFSTDTETIPPIGQRLDITGGREILNNGVYWANDNGGASSTNISVAATDITWFMFHSWDNGTREGQGMRLGLPFWNSDLETTQYFNLDLETSVACLIYRPDTLSNRWKVSDMSGNIIELRDMVQDQVFTITDNDLPILRDCIGKNRRTFTGEWDSRTNSANSGNERESMIDIRFGENNRFMFSIFRSETTSVVSGGNNIITGGAVNFGIVQMARGGGNYGLMTTNGWCVNDGVEGTWRRAMHQINWTDNTGALNLNRHDFSEGPIPGTWTQMEELTSSLDTNGPFTGEYSFYITDNRNADYWIEIRLKVQSLGDAVSDVNKMSYILEIFKSEDTRIATNMNL